MVIAVMPYGAASARGVRDAPKARLMAIVAACVMFLSTGVASAQTRSASGTAAPAAARTYTPEESKKLGDEARRQAQERERVWDRNMKNLGASICKGC
jgi:hypothetical protein